ncbi:SurA N-terminal domain-containing protein [Lutibaculum baratangense]|uniref:Survival protein SurA (Peptidyl-prolyl cis-trans isomerase SurA) n=1 Tax=Lutibaculum baratangense AMV1 TaxID=631454 RepID=V4R5K5_9HYPH|nr:SurA N-terminal domain-containing protein [Lutibaculum baratangense]ESR27227.1 Survival protein SurA precursor (Peptidyl-prolyl cis-trans isomerase SurA) [Lutibaculum baratangense AMV1]
MKIFTRTILAASALLAVTLAPMLPAAMNGGSGSAWATSIAALVNDDPVTEYEVQQRMRLNRLTGGPAGKQQALDELVEERLKQQAARRVGISANESEVEQAYAGIASRVQLTPSQLNQALQQNGINPDTMKDRLRVNLAWRDVVQGQMRRQVNIRDADIRAELTRRGEAENTTTVYRYTLQPVVFVVPQGSSAAYVRQRMTEASRFAQQFQGCDSAMELAKNYRDTVVQDKVRRGSAELPPEMRQKLAEVSVGGATRPEEIDNGVRVLGVCTREEEQSTEAAQQEIRSELLNEEGQRLSRRLMIDLKQFAVIEYR